MTKKNELTINKFVCTNKGERTGDDLYLKYTVDGGSLGRERFPPKGHGKQNVIPGDVWDVDLSIYFDETVTIELYDGDIGKDQFLDSRTFSDGDPEHDRKQMGQREGRYNLFTTLKQVKQLA
jgi:hypothetical protein